MFDILGTCGFYFIFFIKKTPFNKVLYYDNVVFERQWKNVFHQREIVTRDNIHLLMHKNSLLTHDFTANIVEVLEAPVL